MTKYDYDVGVIGGGAGGLTVATGSAQLGAGTLLIEKERALGGDCLHYGCVPSKTLIRTAKLCHQMKNARAYGLPPVDLSPVDYRQVVTRIRSVIGTIQKHDSEARICSLGAKVEFGDPTFVDDHVVSLKGNTYSARRWVIATGSSAAIPSIKGLETTPYVTNREIFSLDHLPKSMIIIGAGPVSMEMAQAFCRLGSDISVVQRSDQVLKKEDRDMADQLMAILASEGVKFYLDSIVVRTNDHENEVEVIIKNREGRIFSLLAETILLATGRVPNLEGLGIENIGVEFTKKGLKLDKRLRTRQKHIYGAGDVTGSFLFTHAAGYEGSIVISNAIFHLPRKADYTFMPWCTYTDPELASIGMNEKRAKEAGIEYTVWTQHFKDNDRSLAEAQSEGKIKMILDKKENLLGVQILGPQAGELISEWVAVLNGNVRLSTLAAAVHPYPTLGEVNKSLAAAYFLPKIFSGNVKKGLKFLFSLKGRVCGEPV